MTRTRKRFFIFTGVILCGLCIFIIYVCMEGYILHKADKRLISEIGKKAHLFYKHRSFRDVNSSRLENLLDRAGKEGLSDSQNVKWAKRVLDDKRSLNAGHLSENIPHNEKYSADFIGLAKKRQSTRFFLDKKIPDEAIKQILKSAIEAPSSCNRQTWRFLVIEDLPSKNFIAKLTRQEFVRGATVIMLIFVDSAQYSLPAEGETRWMDGSAAIMTVIYAAESLGISSCWVNCPHSPEKIKELLEYFKLDKNLLPVSLVMLGYGDQHLDKPAREKLQYYLLNRKNETK